MKKIFVVALGVALCFGLASSAFAIDTESLESRTSEFLYDRNDAFDLARSPGELYKVKPLHLWTVGSGYSGPTAGVAENEDWDWASDSFLVGVARELGPGSFAVFYEHNKNSIEFNGALNIYENTEFTTQSPGSGETQYYSWSPAMIGPNPDAPGAEFPAYDGDDDEMITFGGTLRNETERTENNLSLAYSWHFTDTIAAGLAYEPHFVDEKETIVVPEVLLAYSGWTDPDLTSADGFPFFGGPPTAGWPFGSSPVNLFEDTPATWFFTGLGPSLPTWLFSTPTALAGPNFGINYSETWYPDVAHSAWTNSMTAVSMNGTRDSDIRVHPFELEGHFTPSDSWDVLAGIGYATVDHKDEVQGVFTYNSVYSGDDPDGNYYDDFANITGYLPLPVDYDSGSFEEVYSSTFTVGGSLADAGFDLTALGLPVSVPLSPHADSAFEDERDGNHWSLYLSPTYFMNDMHSFRLDLGYGREDGDFTGGLIGVLETRDYWSVDINGEETYWDIDTQFTATQVFDSRSSGDYDVTSYFVEPRWYVNFDKVRFSAGLGWYYEEESWDGVMALNMTANLAWANLTQGEYSNANFLFNNDGTAQGSYTGSQTFSGEVTTTTWRAPVAVQFDITEKLTARAGAAYYQTTEEEERADGQVIQENSSWVVYEEDGVTILDEGPDATQYQVLGGTGVPYDNVTDGSSVTTTIKETRDFTTYHLGLGYYFTENLQFDLMFSGQSGWVDSSQLFGSFTIIFP
jgi:hypothetical protein